MIALNPSLATLAAFQTGDLLAFAVQLLNLPAKATRLLSSLRGILSGIVGHDPIRAVGRHLNPEQTHLVVFGKALDLDRLPVRYFGSAPGQRIHSLVGLCPAG